MIDTDSLIEQLSGRAQPVGRLASPMLRTLLWLATALMITSAMVIMHGARPGWLQELAAPGAALEWLASIVTGVLAAYAAFQISVPGRSPSWAWLPLPSAVLWLAGIGLGCLDDFGRMGSSAFAFHVHGWECAWAISLTSIPLGAVMLLMVRHAGAVRPGPTAMLAVLGAAALSAAAVTLIHDGENALMVLLWHAGAVVVLTLLSWISSRRLFSWIGYARS